MTVEDIRFSGFWSQGDGASFEGYVSDFKLFTEFLAPGKYKELAEFENKPDCRVLRFWSRLDSHHYCHSNTMDFDGDFEIAPIDEDEDPLVRLATEERDRVLEGLFESLMDAAKEAFRDAANKLYADLEEEYDYLTSDEAILEALFANEHILLEDIKEYEDEHAEESAEELPAL